MCVASQTHEQLNKNFIRGKNDFNLVASSNKIFTAYPVGAIFKKKVHKAPLSFFCDNATNKRGIYRNLINRVKVSQLTGSVFFSNLSLWEWLIFKKYNKCIA